MPKRTKTRRKRKSKKRNYYAPMTILKSVPDYTCMFHNNATTSITTNATAPVLGTIVFDLLDCLDHTNWSANFDYYRINWVRVTFEPCRTQVMNTQTDQTTAPTSITEVPKLCLALDRDTSAAPLTYQAVQVRGGSRECLATEKAVWKFTPNRLVNIYRSTADAYMIDNNPTQWLDVAYTNVPHYGLKYALEQCQPIGAFKYYIRKEYCVSFKEKRR